MTVMDDTTAALDNLLAAIMEYDDGRPISDTMDMDVRRSDSPYGGIIMDMTTATTAVIADIIRTAS